MMKQKLEKGEHYHCKRTFSIALAHRESAESPDHSLKGKDSKLKVIHTEYVPGEYKVRIRMSPVRKIFVA